MNRRGDQDQAFTVIFPERFKRQVFEYLHEYSDIPRERINEKTLEAFIFMVLRNFLEEAEVSNNSSFWVNADELIEEFTFSYRGEE